MKRTANWSILTVLAMAVFPAEAQQLDSELDLTFNGAGWVDFGRIEESTVNDISNDYNKNWFQNGGAVVGMSAALDEHWSTAAGIGVIGTHLARGSRGLANLWYPFWVAFVSEARVTYEHSAFLAEDGDLRIHMGLFGYGYNPDAKNLGSYLMHGYVYPGTLVPGGGSMTGAVVSYEKGGLRNDIIVKSESEDRPRYDYSVADVVTYKVHPGFEVGAGVNFYRLVENNSNLTSPGAECPGPPDASLGGCAIVDTTGGTPDTITGSLAGTKLMARFRLDPKTFLGMTGVGGREWGSSDWVIYGEAALLGVKEYPVFYDDILRRIPVMIGFNIPVLGWLDYLSVEAEYYASRNSSDNLPASYGAWVPHQFDPANKKRDNLKWSVNAARGLFGNMQLSAQVANDHFRPGGTHNSPAGTEALTTPTDWRWNFKVAYFF